MWFWPALRVLRVYAPYVTLPFAAIIGFVGYNLERKISNKYTPYKGIREEYVCVQSRNLYIITEPIKETREERLMNDEVLQSATDVERLRYSADVLGRNLSPSLQGD